MHKSASTIDLSVNRAKREMKSIGGAWVILASAWLLGFAMFAPILCIPPVAHIIKEELRVSHAAVGFLFSIPIAVLIALAIPSGFLADVIGTQKAVGIGAIIMAVGSLLRGVSDTFSTLLVFTSLYGIGFSMIYPNLPKIVGLWFPHEKVGIATGVYTTGITAGCTVALAITLPLVFPLTNTFQGTFMIWSIPAVLAAILWWFAPKDPPVPAYTNTQTPRASGMSTPPHSLWKNRDMWCIALLLFFNNLHFYTWSGWSPALLMMKGVSPESAALIASSRGWASFPLIFLMPWISYKVGLRKPFIWGSGLLTAFASWAAIYIPASLGWPLMVLVGIAQGGIFPMILALPLELLPNESVGTASGTVLSVGYVGGFLGPWFAGYIVDTTASLDWALLMLAGTAIISALIGFVIPEPGRRTPTSTAG